MANKTCAWRANDGTLHNTPREASERDVDRLAGDLLVRFGANTSLRDALRAHSEEIVRVLTEYNAHHLCATHIDKSAPQEGEKGPASKDPPAVYVDPSYHQAVADNAEPCMTGLAT